MRANHQPARPHGGAGDHRQPQPHPAARAAPGARCAPRERQLHQRGARYAGGASKGSEARRVGDVDRRLQPQPVLSRRALSQPQGAHRSGGGDHPVFVMESFSGPGATNALGKQFFQSHGVEVMADGSIRTQIPNTQIFPCQDALFLLRKMQTRDSMLQGLQDAMRYAAGVGVTTHLDQGGFPAAGDNTDGAAHFDRYRAHDSVRALFNEGKLTNRIWINFLHLETDPQTPELMARLLNAWNDFGDDMVRVVGIGEFTAGPFLEPGTPQWFHGTRLVADAGWRNENHSLNFPAPLFPVPGPLDWKVIIDGWQKVHNDVVAAGNPDGITKLRWVLAHVPFIDQEHLTRLQK